MSLVAIGSYGLLQLTGEDLYLFYTFVYKFNGGEFFEFLLATFLIFLGSFFVSRIFTTQDISLPEFKSSPNIYILSIIVLLVTLIYLLVTLNHLVLYRNYYQFIEEAGEGLLLSLAELIMAFLPAVIRILSPNKGGARVVNIILLILSFLYLYSAATKLCAGVLVFYMASSFFRSGRFRTKHAFLCVFAIVALAIAMQQRKTGYYGLLTLFDSLLSVYHNPLEVLGFVFAILAAPIYVFSETLIVANLNFSDLLIELSPKSGISAGWYEVFSYHRISSAVPFSAVGTVQHHSIYLLPLFGAILEFTILFLSSALRRISPKMVSIFIILSSLFLWNMMMGYNLRACFRWVYLFLLLSFVLLLVPKRS